LPNTIFSRLKMFRPRFSLFTLLLLTTIISLSVALWRVGSEVVPLREEVRELRNELGILQINESDKIHAIRVETFEDSFYRFRIYLPKGKQYTFNYAYSDIPVEGVPTAAESSSVEPGEYLIYVRKKNRSDPKTGKPTRHATMRVKVEPTEGQRFSSANFSIFVSGDWIFNKKTQIGSCSITSIGKQIEIFHADEAVGLIRFREFLPGNIQRGPKGEMRSYTIETIEEPCDGFMIWVEEEQVASRDATHRRSLRPY